MAQTTHRCKSLWNTCRATQFSHFERYKANFFLLERVSKVQQKTVFNELNSIHLATYVEAFS